MERDGKGGLFLWLRLRDKGEDGLEFVLCIVKVVVRLYGEATPVLVFSCGCVDGEREREETRTMERKQGCARRGVVVVTSGGRGRGVVETFSTTVKGWWRRRKRRRRG